MLSNKTAEPNPAPRTTGSLASYLEAGALPSTDADSVESTESQQAEPVRGPKPSSTIGKLLNIKFFNKIFTS